MVTRVVVTFMALIAIVGFASVPAAADTFVYLVRPNRTAMAHPKPGDASVIEEHFNRLSRLRDAGRLVLAGPAMENGPKFGIVVFEASDLDAAKAFAGSDPAVQAKVFDLEGVWPFQIALTRSAPFPADYATNAEGPPVHKEVVVNGTVTDVWAAWTTVDGVRKFLGIDSNIDLKIGGPYEFFFNPDKTAPDRGGEGMRVLSYLPERMLSVEWNAPPKFGKLRNVRTWVVIELKQVEPGKVLVTLDHYGFGSDGDWPKVRAYFEDAWGYVLGALSNHFH